MGYLGLEDRLSAVWYGGRNVIVYPDGTVIDTDTGEFVRLPEEFVEEMRGQKPVFTVNNILPKASKDPNSLLLTVLFLAAIIAMVAMRGKK